MTEPLVTILLLPRATLFGNVGINPASHCLARFVPCHHRGLDKGVSEALDTRPPHGAVDELLSANLTLGLPTTAITDSHREPTRSVLSLSRFAPVRPRRRELRQGVPSPDTCGCLPARSHAVCRFVLNPERHKCRSSTKSLVSGRHTSTRSLFDAPSVSGGPGRGSLVIPFFPRPVLAPSISEVSRPLPTNSVDRGLSAGSRVFVSTALRPALAPRPRSSLLKWQ